MAIKERLNDLYSKRFRKEYLKIIDKVNEQFSMIRGKNTDLSKTTEKLRERLRNGEDIKDIVPEALAACKEAVRRSTGYKIPYDVQAEAAIAMIEDKTIVEMQTGEGKTMVQVLSAYLSALEATKSLDKNEWGSVHVLTSNDFLAEENAKENKGVFSLLGLSCGCVNRNRPKDKRARQEYIRNKREAYDSDIVYSTATTIAFDMLEDNNVDRFEDKYIRKKLSKAIVDEADDVLLDQALNPLLLSSSRTNVSEEEQKIVDALTWANSFVEGEFNRKKDGSKDPVDCYVEETENNPPYVINPETGKKEKAVFREAKITRNTGEVTISQKLIDYVYKLVEKEKGLSPKEKDELAKLRLECISDILKAKYLLRNGIDYQIVDKITGAVVKPYDSVDARIALIDNNTGTYMMDSKYSGFTQTAVELVESIRAKNDPRLHYRVPLTVSGSTLGKNTYPNLIKAYENVSGMTGTSNDEAFEKIYGFSTYKVPTRKPCIRVDKEDELYLTKKQKYQAIIDEIIRCTETLQPVLIGTTSVEESKEISKLLAENGIVHNLLNAENHTKEGSIISTAGQLGSVTVATNIAGRGVDIQLGEGVKELGGLYVIGTSKNNSERIDRQLRGRAARQGDPGCSKYFQSVEDDLVQRNMSQNLYKQFHIYAESLTTDKSGRITAKAIIDKVNKCQKNQEGIDLANRLLREKCDAPFAEIMRSHFKYRDSILKATSLKDINELMKKTLINTVNMLFNGVTLDLIPTNANVTKSFFNEEDFKRIFGNSIDVESCFDSNPEKYKNNIINALTTRFDSMPKNYEKTKSKMLRTMDEFWSSFLGNEIWEQKSFDLATMLNQPSDPFKAYELMMKNKYSQCSLQMLIEQSAYILNPSLEYGKYSSPELSVYDEEEFENNEGYGGRSC